MDILKSLKRSNSSNRIVVLSQDPGHIYILENGKLKIDVPQNILNTDVIIAILSPKNVVATEFELNRSIPLEELEDEVTMRIFEEMSLDQEIEYTIRYIEKRSADRDQSKYRAIEAFFIENHTLYEKYTPLLENIQYIDFLILPLQLFKNLYTYEFLQKSGHDAFVYFSQDDAFLSVYSNGEYLYGKSFKSSLEILYQRFSEIIGEKLDYNLFTTLLTSDPFPPEYATYHEFFEIMYGEILSGLSDTLTHARRLNNIQEFRDIYLTTSVGNIPSFCDYANNFSNIELKNLTIENPFDTELSVDLLTLLAFMEGGHLKFQDDGAQAELNFSIFHRPPPFKERDAGRFVIATAASLVLAFTYPAWELGRSLYIDYQLGVQTAEYNELHAVVESHKARKAALVTQQQDILKAIDAEKSLVTDRQALLEDVDKRLHSYLYKSKTLTELFVYFNRYGVKIYELDFHDDYVLFTLYAKSDKPITTLIKGLVTSNRYKLVETKRIEWDPQRKMYISNVGVAIR